MRALNFVILSFALACISVPAWAVVEVTPSNLVYPSSPGGLFSFDLTISSDPTGITAMGFKSTVNVSSPAGPGNLTLDVTNSQAVADYPGYWISSDNSAGVTVLDRGSYNYEFGDNPSNPYAEPLFSGDTMARYAFTWNGVPGDYTFTFDLDTASSYIALDDFVSKEALLINPGSYPGDSSSFTVTIPEPATLTLFALGGAIFLRKRRT